MVKRFFKYYKPHMKLVVFVLFIVALYALIELSIPVFTRHILNDLIPTNDFRQVVIIAGVLVGLLVLYAVFHYIVGYYGHMLGISMERDMRMDAFQKLQELSFDYYDVNKTGVIMTRLTDDLHQVAELAHHGIEEVLAVTLMMVVGYVYLIQLNFVVTTILFVLFLGMIAIMVFARRNMIVAFRNLRKEHAEINSGLEGSISGIRLTRAFANETYEIDRFYEENVRYIGAYEKAYRALASTNASNNFFVQFINVVVLVLGAFLVLNGDFSVGDMFAYFLYFSMLVGPVKRLMTMLETFQQGWAGFERFDELLNEPVSVQNREHAKDVEIVDGAITFDSVSFAYNQQDSNVLTNFSLNIEKGKTVALVGPSGVGKTTIAQLIPRFYDIQKGKISIDGVDIQDMTLNSLRRHIGYVQQDVVIFWGTIANNIAYGKPSATLLEVKEAAKKAGIHSFIESLPHKYDTMVGERGVMLSGGQKQRISIARIFLKNPRILILDEATSALDNITEAYIQESFDELSKGRTVVVVAHRLTTVQNADVIVVLDQDGIAQQGSHAALLAQDGHYKNLYEASKYSKIMNEYEMSE